MDLCCDKAAPFHFTHSSNRKEKNRGMGGGEKQQQQKLSSIFAVVETG